MKHAIDLKTDPDFPKLISAYRKNIRDKYSLDRIKAYPQFAEIREDAIERMVSYFLELLYPELKERIELDNAFASLKGFVQNPSKVFGLIGSLGLSLWRIGKYLSKAFQSGIAALSSYLTAHEFENRLLVGAKEKILNGKDILLEENFKELLAIIPIAEAEKFRKDTVSLFRTLSNDELVDRIILILDSIIQKMKEKPSLYSSQDIKGIELGLSILTKGKKILLNLSKTEKVLVIDAINQIEKDYYESCL